MATLLLRLAGPMQSWGTESKFSVRNTGREPSKSGVIGMVAAALGRGRGDPIADLTALRFGVRIDQSGDILRDFHTAHNPKNEKLAYVSDRFYLSDAIFLVGLEGDPSLLIKIDEAVRHPVYPLFLGRRSCPPAGQVSLGVRETSLTEALRGEDWLAADWYRRRMPEKVELETVCDAQVGEGGVFVRDSPESFLQERRVYTERTAVHDLCGKQVVNDRGRKFQLAATEHDAIAQLKGA